jgi:micrococcal nuclease
LIDDSTLAVPTGHNKQARFRARSRLHFVPFIALVLVVALARWWWSAEQQPAAAPPPLLAEGEHPVVRVVDGDTLLLAGDVRVRLLGVDTPETVKPDHPPEPFGPEASEFTRAFVAAGPMRLTFDRERVDRYGRQLAFVWRGNECLNEQLIAAGLSPAMTKYPYSPTMKDRFRAAEREAKRKKLGIWATTPEAALPTATGSR